MYNSQSRHKTPPLGSHTDGGTSSDGVAAPLTALAKAQLDNVSTSSRKRVGEEEEVEVKSRPVLIHLEPITIRFLLV